MEWGGFIMNLVELDARNPLVRMREKGNIIVRPLAHPSPIAISRIRPCSYSWPISASKAHNSLVFVGIVTFNQKVNCHVFVVHSQQTIQHSDGKGSSGNEINRTFVDKHPPIPTDDANVIALLSTTKENVFFRRNRRRVNGRTPAVPACQNLTGIDVSIVAWTHQQRLDRPSSAHNCRMSEQEACPWRDRSVVVVQDDMEYRQDPSCSGFGPS